MGSSGVVWKDTGLVSAVKLGKNEKGMRDEKMKRTHPIGICKISQIHFLD